MRITRRMEVGVGLQALACLGFISGSVFGICFGGATAPKIHSRPVERIYFKEGSYRIKNMVYDPDWERDTALHAESLTSAYGVKPNPNLEGANYNSVDQAIRTIGKIGMFTALGSIPLGLVGMLLAREEKGNFKFSKKTEVVKGGNLRK